MLCHLGLVATCRNADEIVQVSVTPLVLIMLNDDCTVLETRRTSRITNSEVDYNLLMVNRHSKPPTNYGRG